MHGQQNINIRSIPLLEDYADASKHVGVLTVYKILFIYRCCAFGGVDNKLQQMFRHLKDHLQGEKYQTCIKHGKVITIPIDAWRGPQNSRKFRLLEFLDNRHTKVAMLSAPRTGRLYPHEISQVLISVSDRVELRATALSKGLIKKFQCPIGNRPRNLLACSAVPQPTAPLHIPV